MNWNTIISAEQLTRSLDEDDVVVVDARYVLGDVQAGELAWWYQQQGKPGIAISRFWWEPEPVMPCATCT